MYRKNKFCDLFNRNNDFHFFFYVKIKTCKATNDVSSSLEETSMLFGETLNLLKKIQEFFAVQLILTCLGSFIFTLITVRKWLIIFIDNEEWIIERFLMNEMNLHQLFTVYSSFVRKIKMNESVPVTDVLLDLVSSIGFAAFHLIDFYSIACASSLVYNMVWTYTNLSKISNLHVK